MANTSNTKEVLNYSGHHESWALRHTLSKFVPTYSKTNPIQSNGLEKYNAFLFVFLVEISEDIRPKTEVFEGDT